VNRDRNPGWCFSSDLKRRFNMSKLMYELEISTNAIPDYIYLETDDDIDIDIGTRAGSFIPGQPAITHITVIDTDIGMEPDLVISRRLE
jgi:hypothetical protein